MAADKLKKGEKELSPLRPSTWLTPFVRMEDVMEDFIRRPFGRTFWPNMPGTIEDVEMSPSVDIYEEGDHIVLKSELPGISKEDLDIKLTDDTITISGEKKKEEKIERKNYYRLERSFGSFKRSFALPSDVQSDKAKASFKDGILEVTIPKSDEAKKKEKKIKIE